MVATIGKAIGAEIRFEELTPEQVRERNVATMPLGLLESALHGPAKVFAGVQQVTGRPARTFAQWVEDHVDAFR